MDKKYFEKNVTMAVEVEYDGGGRHWYTMPGSEVREFCDNLPEDEGISDIDYCTEQEDPEIRKILDKAYEIWRDAEKRAGFKNLDEAIDSLLEDPKPAKRVWSEDEIKDLIQTNDKALYGALRKLYAEQTADEQESGETKHQNGVGFNGVDAPILSSFAEFLAKTGFLTPKQKAVARRKLVKYNKQLTRLANAG